MPFKLDHVNEGGLKINFRKATGAFEDALEVFINCWWWFYYYCGIKNTCSLGAWLDMVR
jgi:hypothetical protein